MKKLFFLFSLLLLNVHFTSCNQGDRLEDVPFYLAENGITVKAKDSVLVRTQAILNGITYTLVNDSLIQEIRAQGWNDNSFINDSCQIVTTSVTDMSELFSDATGFNQDIGSWDVSNVTNMSYMFGGANVFNRDIGSWDVSNVTNMRWMFNSTSFNQDIGSWDVSNVDDMGQMFSTSPFNQDIGGWDVSNVTKMGYMFSDASSFNQDIGSWDVSSVHRMSGMFFDAKSFNKDISNWDFSNETDMRHMFNGASLFNQDVSIWGVANNRENSTTYDSLSYQIITTPWSEISGFDEAMGSEIKYSKDGKSFQFVGDINDEFEFVGIVQNFIILSYGGISSAESSDPFWIFDLENQKFVFESEYHGGLRIVNSEIEYVQVVYNPYESYDSTFIKKASNWLPKCSDEIEKLRIKYPGSIGYTEKIIFDVSTLKAKGTGVYECQYFQ
tara:strand:- start:1706 stop:3028 length:1323 start_codon:yes stop_codon:yes gene_type:complete